MVKIVKRCLKTNQITVTDMRSNSKKNAQKKCDEANEIFAGRWVFSVK